MQPLIGISPRPKYIESIGKQLRAYAVFQTYTDGVIAAGGTPVMLVPTGDEHVGAVLDHLDGVLLPGGGDIHPGQYGEDARPEVTDVDDERDRYEIAMVKAAHARKMPVFAICRGLQIVNVAFGGSLVQDLPSQRGAEGHDVIGDAAYVPHSSVAVEPASRIATIIGGGEHSVNSLHHQAVDKLGDGLSVVGRADDGTVEAIEHADPDWPMLAVQWHPEFLRVKGHEESGKLFGAFIEMAEKYRADR